MIVQEGSIWSSTDGTRFRVLHVIDIHDHTWVHYRKDYGIKKPEDPDTKEYSCYLESFITRFRQQPE